MMNRSTIASAQREGTMMHQYSQDFEDVVRCIACAHFFEVAPWLTATASNARS